MMKSEEHGGRTPEDVAEVWFRLHSDGEPSKNLLTDSLLVSSDVAIHFFCSSDTLGSQKYAMVHLSLHDPFVPTRALSACLPASRR